ncbi:MAG: LapA family protein [Alphaproteobacteria bacterium]|nr:LapA family protein [Alphaproteobacteria bacterium]
MTFIKALIGLIFICTTFVFAFVNNDMADFNLWPTGIEVTVSLSVAVVFFVIFGYVFGWLITWLSYSPVRRALRLQRKENKKLNKEQEKLTKEIEGLHGNIETLKAAVPTTEQSTDKSWLKSFFSHNDKTEN